MGVRMTSKSLRRWLLATGVAVAFACKADPIADLKAGKLEAIEKALANGTIQAAGVDAAGEPLLVVAYEADQPAAGKLLLDKGADPNVVRANGQPLFQEVVAAGRAPWVDALLASHLLDVHATDADGTTALLLAVKRGDRELARRLIARGADPYAATRHGVAAVDLDKGASANRVFDRSGSTLWCWWNRSDTLPSALVAAAAANDVATLETTIDKAQCPGLASSRDRQGKTPLMAAVAAGSTDAARFLLDHGADVHGSRFSGGRFVTALDLARDPAMQALLRAHGARPPPERKAEVIIAAGAKTADELKGALDRWKEVGSLASGFPQVFQSDLMPGLNPGWQIVVLGFCEEGVGRANAANLRQLQKDVYVRTVTVKTEQLACPPIGDGSRIAPVTVPTPEGPMIARQVKDTVSIELHGKSGELLDWKWTTAPPGDENTPYPCDGTSMIADGAYLKVLYTCYSPGCTTPSSTPVTVTYWAERKKLRSAAEDGETKPGDCDQ
jgi:ankyrin repeat protein